MHLLMLSLRGSTGICGAFDFSKTFWIKIPTTWPPKEVKSDQRSPPGTCDDVIWFHFAPHKKIKHFYLGAQPFVIFPRVWKAIKAKCLTYTQEPPSPFRYILLIKPGRFVIEIQEDLM